MALRAFAELSEQGDKIAVRFPYSPEGVEAIKAVPGRRFTDKDKRDKHWTLPLTLDAGKRLREEFGQGLTLGDRLKAWGQQEVRRQRGLATLAGADDAELANVSEQAAAWLRPYQRADVKLMAAGNVGNFNQPGVGKTVETIYAIQEAGIKGPHLIVCPTTLFKDPWRDELAAHVPGARVLWGSTPAERKGAINFTAMEAADGKADDIFLLINPEMVRAEKFDGETSPPADRRVLSRDHKGNAYCSKADAWSRELFAVKRWGAIVLDEFHKFGLGEDRNTMFARGVDALGKAATRRYALSGTPMGGKTIRLWGVLNFIEPQEFSSKWRWAEQWLEIDDSGMGKKIGGMIKGREDEFNEAHARFMIRRNRADALPGLPPKVTLNVACPMTPKQRKVYDDFARAAEVVVSGGRVSATGVLAEFARLKQLANALCEIVDGDVQPTTESGKLPVLLDRLDTHGVRAKEPEPTARAIVASESARFVRLLEQYLGDNGIAVKRLDGSVTGPARDAVIDWYKADVAEARTLVMTTQTGGVGLNLGMTTVICIMDETWNPDDQGQLEDRGMRNRSTPLNVLYFRTEQSIQDYIWETTFQKGVTNKNVMDLRAALGRGAAK